jgi:type IV secretory pathway VirB3-like protein
MMQPKIQMEGMDFSFMTTVIGIVFQIVFLIPAILVIVHLFKAEPEE